MHTRGLGLTLIMAVAFGGCASLQAAQTQDTERLLVAAGFEVKAADTPEAAARLQALPARKIVLRPRAGVPHYVYADPTVCHCIYVGTEAQYEQFNNLRHRDELARENAVSVSEFASPFYPDFWNAWP